MASLTGFYIGETKLFSIILRIDGDLQDITGDAVTFRMKENKSDSDASAVLTKTADVTTRGAGGYADFELLPSDTDTVSPGTYHCDIEWVLATGEEFIAYSGTLHIPERVSDS